MTDGPSEPSRGSADDGDGSDVPPSPETPVQVDTVADTGDETRGPHWMVPAAIGMVLGVVVAVVGVALTRSGNDTVASDVARPPDGTVETIDATDPPPDRSVPVRTAPGTEPIAPETGAPPPTAAAETAAPPPTVAADPSAPASAAPPDTSAPPATAPPAPAGSLADGFVRVGTTDHPIERTCTTLPFAPNGGEFVVFSYLFRDEVGAPQIVDHWFDESGVTGGSYSDNGVHVTAGYEFLGADEFALTLRRLDGETRVVVNPPPDGADECDGRLATNDSATPLFTYTRTIVDICYGSQTGPLQYIGYLSEGGRFSAIPNGDGTATLSYGEPYVVGFRDADAAFQDVAGGADVLANASSDSLTGALTKDIALTIRAASIRECRATDVPF